MNQRDLILLIFFVVVLWVIFFALIVFCFMRVSIHKEALKKRGLSREKRLIEKTKLNIMLINTVALIFVLIFYTFRSAIMIVEKLQ